MIMIIIWSGLSYEENVWCALRSHEKVQKCQHVQHVICMDPLRGLGISNLPNKK